MTRWRALAIHLQITEDPCPPAANIPMQITQNCEFYFDRQLVEIRAKYQSDTGKRWMQNTTANPLINWPYYDKIIDSKFVDYLGQIPAGDSQKSVSNTDG